tara:strand:+ start:1225 stop:1881 length:657 start_codon:yes stop_codon:yes gene_type:complete
MFFSLLPSIEYAKSPISYPFSQSDYILAKNFFKKYQIDENIYDYAIYFDKYVLQTGERLDTIASKFYGNVLYDWVIAITNNMINPGYALPMDDNDVRIYAEGKYGDDTYSGIHHYETLAYKDINNNVLIPAGLTVDYKWYTSSHELNNGSSTVSIPGTALATAIYNYDYEIKQNEKYREIDILKPALIDVFINDFKRTNRYQESSDFITEKLKRTSTV